MLGLSRESTWDEIRSRYRSEVRAAHPDVAIDRAASTQRTARLNGAWAMLSRATDNGRVPLPQPTVVTPDVSGHRVSGDGGELVPVVTLHAQPGDVFVQLLDAAHEIGDVSYIDPEAGIIQVLLQGAPEAAQLLISVDTDTDPASASFTLDSMRAATAPSIHDVVAQLARALRTTR